MLKNSKKTIIKTVFSVSSILLLGKLLGFIKQIIIANTFGATIDTDVVNLSQGMVANLQYLLSQTMLTAFVPIYIAVKENEDACKKFISNILKILFIISISISAVIFVFSPIVSKILAPSYAGESLDYLSNNIRIYAFSLFFLVMIAVLNAVLKANEHFVPGELISVNQSLSLIICVLAFGSILGVRALILGFYVYAIVSVLYLSFVARKYLCLTKSSIFDDEGIKKLIKMMMPLLFSYSLVFINQIVDKMLASGLGDGVISAMEYGAVLSNFVASFIGSICGIAFTYIAQSVVGDLGEKAATVVAYFTVIFITALIPISIVAIVNANDITTIIFGHGAFDKEATKNTSYALMGYGFMFIPFAMRELFTRFQYSYQDSKGPLIYSTIGVICNIVLSIILSKFWNIFGITVATSISVLICSVLNIIGSRKHNKCIKLVMFAKETMLWLLGGVVCLILNITIRENINIDSTVLRFIVVVAVSVISYTVIVSPIIISMVRKKKQVL